MPSEFRLYDLLPRHTRKILNAKHKGTKIQHFGDKVLALDKKESAWGSVGTDEEYHRYPDPKAEALRSELSEYYKVDMPKILVGNGTDALMDLIMRTFCTSGKDHILGCAPHSADLKHFACLNNLVLEEINLSSLFQLSIFKVRSQINEHTKILFLSNPNPISGVSLRGVDMVDLIEDFEGLVVVDESDIEYSPENSLLEYLDTYPNLIILRSFSNAWGLAGLRLGVAFASPEITRVLHLVKPPFAVNSAAQQIGIKALHVPEQKDRYVAETVLERNRLKDQLQQLKFVEEVHHSDANFLLVRVEKADALEEYLRDEQIAVLNVSHLHNCQNCLRITVGLPEDNQRLIKALREMPSKTAPARIFMKKLGKSLQKASVFLGFFKKIIG
jgi:histidinol-phosphate aminotransferase